MDTIGMDGYPLAAADPDAVEDLLDERDRTFTVGVSE